MGNSPALNSPDLEKIPSDGELDAHGLHVRYGGLAMQGWRKYMEDAMFVYSPDFEQSGLLMFGIFDGHGGDRTAKYAAEHLGPFLWSEFAKADGVISHELLTRAFLEFDWSLCMVKTERHKHQSCGTTACICVIQAKKKLLHICHMGDSRAVVYHQPANVAKVIYITKDHVPLEDVEAARILAVSKKEADPFSRIQLRVGRVFVGNCSSLNVCRGFGDHDFKRVMGVQSQEQAVIAIPDYRCFSLADFTTLNVFMASDGIWGAILTGNNPAVLPRKPITAQAVYWCANHAARVPKISDSLRLLFDDLIAASFPQIGKSTDNMSAYFIQITNKAAKPPAPAAPVPATSEEKQQQKEEEKQQEEPGEDQSPKQADEDEAREEEDAEAVNVNSIRPEVVSPPVNEQDNAALLDQKEDETKAVEAVEAVESEKVNLVTDEDAPENDIAFNRAITMYDITAISKNVDQEPQRFEPVREDFEEEDDDDAEDIDENK